MKTSFIAVLHLNSSSNPADIYLLGGHIYASYTKNQTTFPNPDPTMQEFHQQLTLLGTLIHSQDGSTAKAIELEHQTEIVYENLKELIFYTNKVAKGNKAIIDLSGFDSKAGAMQHGIPGKAIIKRVQEGSKEHSIKVFVLVLDDADRYSVEYTTTPNDPDSWKYALNAVGRNMLEITNLKRGVEVYIRVTGGNTHGWGPHSDIVSYIPQ